MKGDDTVSGLKSCNILGFATILCDKFILAGEFLKGMIMKDDLSLHSSGTILLSSNTTAFHFTRLYRFSEQRQVLTI